MPDFRFSARSATGENQSGLLHAENEQALADQLTKKGLTLINATAIASAASAITWLDRLTSVPAVTKVFFTQNLRVMIRAGLPIGRALSTIAAQVNNRLFRKVILAIRQAVESGEPLAAALAKHPKIFSELYIAMISAGEASGKLDDVLDRLTTQLKKQYALRGKIRNALIYPIVVLVGIVGVSIVMLVVVLPQITAIFEESDAALPLPTRILIAVSHFLVQRWWVMILAIVVILVGAILIPRTPRGQRTLHRLWLRLPIIGPIIRKVTLASFTRSLSSLLSTDLPIVQTFHIISRTIGNRLYRAAIVEAADQLKTGATLVRALDRHGKLFPPLITQMIAIGEESGTLEDVTNEVAVFLEDDVDQTMANLSTILEPVIILLLGLGVTGIALAIILPIYSLGNALG